MAKQRPTKRTKQPIYADIEEFDDCHSIVHRATFPTFAAVEQVIRDMRAEKRKGKLPHGVQVRLSIWV